MNDRRTPICPRCGIRKKSSGCGYCPECSREYQAEARRRRAEADPELCPQCHKNPRAPGKTWCRECLTKAQAYYRARAKRKIRFAELLAEASGCREILTKMQKGKSNT